MIKKIIEKYEKLILEKIFDWTKLPQLKGVDYNGKKERKFV